MQNSGGSLPASLHGLRQRHSNPIPGITVASPLASTSRDGASGGRSRNRTKTFFHESLVGQPLASLTGSIFEEADACVESSCGDDHATAAAVAAADAATTGGACAELCIAWPPTFPVGAPAEVVELRVALSFDAAGGATVDNCGDETACLNAAISAAGGGDGAVLAAAAAGCCSRLLAFNEDFVVGDEALQINDGGVASARLRLHADVPGVTSCILTGDQGVPTLESFQDPAPLMGLPQAARDEAHRLLWRMMHEALPPNHSVLPYDPDAFRTSVDLLPPKLQAALSWAWTHHFRPFAHDFGFLLESLPAAEAVAGGGSEVAAAAVCTPHVVAMAASSPYTADCAVVQGVEANVDELSHYQSVLAQMVVFLRDNDMFACLATLLQTAVARGLTLLGEDGASVNLAASPHLDSQLRTPYDGDGGSSGGGKATAALSSALAALRAAAATRSVRAAAEEANYVELLAIPNSQNGWTPETASAHGSPRALVDGAVPSTASGYTIYNDSYMRHIGGDSYRGENLQIRHEESGELIENVRGRLSFAGCSNNEDDAATELFNGAAKSVVPVKPQTGQLKPLLALRVMPVLSLVIGVLVAASAPAVMAAAQWPYNVGISVMIITAAVFEHCGGVISFVALLELAIMAAAVAMSALLPLWWQDAHSLGQRDRSGSAASTRQHGILQLITHMAGAVFFGAVTWRATVAAAAAAAATVTWAAPTPIIAAAAIAIVATAAVIQVSPILRVKAMRVHSGITE